MESLLFRISVVTSIIGIIALYVISDQMVLPELNISDLDSGKVRLIAHVDAMTRFGNTTILKLRQDDFIDAVLYDSGFADVMNFSRGDRIELIGEMGEYEGRPQIISHMVRKI